MNNTEAFEFPILHIAEICKITLYFIRQHRNLSACNSGLFPSNAVNELARTFPSAFTSIGTIWALR